VSALPWSKSSQSENLDLFDKAEGRFSTRIINGLEDGARSAWIEALAVPQAAERSLRGAILLPLVGPPGVGKTIASSVLRFARALKPQVRPASRLAASTTEAEISADIAAHYVGAMPGRIIQAVQQPGTNNPLIMLDEIDKVELRFPRRSPSSAFSSSRSEQNFSFPRPTTLNVPFRFSRMYRSIDERQTCSDTSPNRRWTADRQWR
jgi:ATP-dependent Lon protease